MLWLKLHSSVDDCSVSYYMRYMQLQVDSVCG